MRYLLLLLFTTICFGQQHNKEIKITEVTYQYLLATSGKELSPRQEKEQELLKTITATFGFTNQLAKYQNQSNPALYSDLDYFLAKLKLGSNIIYNIKNRTQFLFLGDSYSNFYFKMPIKNKDWKLVNETKTINNIVCYKATLVDTYNYQASDGTIKEYTKHITAWYAPSIAVPVGLNQMNGLPGLIMQLDEANNGSFIVTSIVFNKQVPATYFDAPKRFTERTDYEAYREEMRKKMRDVQNGNFR
ncbi:GLPGLI family protein [Flavobacterium agricola]|uniref:GLPGLI family protein n=1 Tax=Flavobacterium agricola TaxID=2870839 RepID=A0ABY6LWU5_9FLAO|nr:GLPGLI family protein [Flavobacterium agricola]UYW00800.1 GLPGLI family protein [Flavobacterium agricola]